MISSMTAFSRKERSYDWGILVWEIRSVNHRYLEPGIKVPEALRAQEPHIRGQLRQSLGRGKVDCQLRFQNSQNASSELNLDAALVRQLGEISARVGRLAPQSQPMNVADILKWPGVLQEEGFDYEAVQAAAMALFEEALQEVITDRQREGEALRGFLAQRLSAIREIVSEVRERLPTIFERQREYLQERLAEIREGLDPARVEQELVLMLQKSDVGEELDRLEAHVNEVQRVLGTDGPKGRRLDFLMQELNREANTLSSKSIASQTTLRAVDLKVLIEQMREQVQNIE